MTDRSGRTHDNLIWWTSGENTPEEIERGEAKNLEAQIPEVDHDRPMEKDVWHLIFNFRRKHFK
jgi:hypothetical protein